MSLKIYIDTQVQAFRQRSSQGLLIGLQGCPNVDLVAIHGAYSSAIIAEPTKVELVKINHVGRFDSSKQLYNFEEIERIELPSTKIKYDIDSAQYVVDPAVDIDLIIDDCIYFLEFTNGVNIFKSEVFFVNDGFNFPRGIDYDKIGVNMKVY